MFDKKRVLIAVLVAILALLMRLPGLGAFMTADEANWMQRSAEFYHKIFRNKDTSGSFLTTHPGATGMWLIGAGEVLQEKRIGLDVDESTIPRFRLVATLPIAIATATLIGICSWLTMRWLGFSAGIWSGILLALDPFITGMSQVAHLDAILALSLLSAVISFFVYKKSGNTRYAVLAGIFAGLAMGTKLLPSLWFFVWIPGVTFLQHWKRPWVSIQKTVRVGGLIFGVAMLTFYMLWPALWFSTDIGRSFEKDVPTIVQDGHIEVEISEEPIEPATFYIRTILGRTTPFVLVLSVTAIAIALYGAVRQKSWNDIVWMGLYSIGFLILISAIAKKGDRYALPALVALIPLASWSLTMAWKVIQKRFTGESPLFTKRRVIMSAFVLVVLLFGQIYVWMPYSIAYNNPLFDVRPSSQKGWGEGLDAAARWLNQHPFAERLYIASWYPTVTATYFNGRTMSLSSREDHRIGFVVTYRNMYGRAQDDIASNVLDEFVDKEPEHVIHIHGEPYVWIYNTLGPRYFTKNVGELVSGREVGQLVPIDFDNWDRIDFAIATYSGRNNTEDVIVHIREDVNATKDIRTIRVNARNISDQDWQAFPFEPITDSKGKTYYIAITSPTSQPGNAVTVRYVQEDVKPGQIVIRNEPLQSGETMDMFIREGDLGYRLVY